MESHVSPDPEAPRSLSRWAWIRAVFITLIVGVCFIQASPAPGKVVKKKAMSDPIALEELERWVDVFAWFGIERTPEEIADLTVTLSDEWRSWKRTLTKPMDPFTRMTATQQGWGLFTYPDTHPYILEVQIRGDEKKFKSVYVSLDPDLDFQYSVITFRRFRAMYSPGRRVPVTYQGMNKWLAKKAFDAYPEADRVRIRFKRIHTILPGEPNVTERVKTGVFLGKNKVQEGQFIDTDQFIFRVDDSEPLTIPLQGISVVKNDVDRVLQNHLQEALDGRWPEVYSIDTSMGRLRIESADKALFSFRLWDENSLVYDRGTVRFSRTIKRETVQ